MPCHATPCHNTNIPTYLHIYLPTYIHTYRRTYIHTYICNWTKFSGSDVVETHLHIILFDFRHIRRACWHGSKLPSFRYFRPVSADIKLIDFGNATWPTLGEGSQKMLKILQQNKCRDILNSFLADSCNRIFAVCTQLWYWATDQGPSRRKTDKSLISWDS